VIAVLYRGVAAARTMLVRMVVMDVMLGHGCLSYAIRTQCFSAACATAFSTNVST
jgi:hypothetical protein